MKTILSVLILLATALAAGAQNVHKVLFWSGDKTCGYKNAAFTDKDFVQCGRILTNRGYVSNIASNGIGLTIAFLEQDDYILVAARIANSRISPLLFDTDQWGAAHFKTKAGFRAGENPILAETSVPTREIIRSMSSSVKFENSADIFIADGQKISGTKEVRRPDGTRVKVATVVQDKDAQDAAVRRGEIVEERMTNEQRKIRNTALTGKTVPADGFIQGLVYFRRVKKAEFVLFSIDVDDTTFVFQLPRKIK
ncbi:MAG: hypothetical protein ABIO36_08895 [Pyrinomonadaceae bacterium]